MHAMKKKIELGAYTCPVCDCSFGEDDLDSESVIVFNSSDVCEAPNSSYRQYVSEWWEDTYNICGDGCRFEGTPNYHDIEQWVCKNCNAYYDESEEAADCCL